jgi:hypothetical protein
VVQILKELDVTNMGKYQKIGATNNWFFVTFAAQN